MRLEELKEARDICDKHLTSVHDVISRSKTRNVYEARQEIALWLRREKRLSYPAIGMMLRRTHTSVMHMCGESKTVVLAKGLGVE